MEHAADTSRLRHMLDLKLTLGQVLAGFFTTVTAVVTVVVYVQGTFETKIDADKRELALNNRIARVESAYEESNRNQVDILKNVSRILGILEEQKRNQPHRE